MAKARIEGELTMRDQQFNQTLDKAEKRAQGFGQRVQRFVGVEGFKGERRVTTASRRFAGSFGQITSGADLAAAAVQGLESSLNVGFGGAVALVSGIALLEKFVEQAKASKKAFSALQTESNKSIGLESQLSPEGITEAAAKLKEVRDKAFEESTNKANQQKSGALNLLDKVTGGHRAADFDESLLKPIDDADKKLDELGKARGKAELAVAAAHQLSSDGYEKEAQLAEVAAKFDEKRAAIRLAPLDSGTKDRLDAADKEQKIQEATINKKAAAREADLQMAIKIANIEAGNIGGGPVSGSPGQSGLGFARSNSTPTTASQRRILALRTQVQATDEEAQRPDTTPDERTRLTAKRLGLQTNLDNAQYDYANSSSEQRTAERLDAQKRKQFSDAANKKDAVDKFGVPEGAYGFKSTKPTVPEEGGSKKDDLSGFISSANALVTAINGIAGKIEVA